MAKIKKKGISGPGFAGGIVLTIIVLLFFVVIFYPKTLQAAEIFFNLLGIEKDQKENQKLTGGQLDTISKTPEFAINIVTRAYEKCAAAKGNDCLCNSGENLDLDAGSPMILSKSGNNDIEVNYKGKSLIVPEIEGCRLDTVIREPDYKFSDRKIPFGAIELSKDSKTGEIITYSSNNIKFSFRLNPIHLYKHKENQKTYLCLVPRNINYQMCS